MVAAPNAERGEVAILHRKGIATIVLMALMAKKRLVPEAGALRY